MKNLWIVLLMVVVNQLKAQDYFNYQAIVSDANGAIVASQSIGVRLSIIYDSSSGTVAYSEIHSATTDASGLINIAVGNGTSSDSYAAIDWSRSSVYLKSEIDLGSGYVDVGTDLIGKVPMALYAKTLEGLTITSGTISATGANLSGTVTASAFVGDGSGLTNLASSSIDGITVETSGNLNVAMGNNAFGTNGSGVSNVAIGERSMSVSNTSGSWNVAVGAATMIYNTAGNENTAIGSGAMEENVTGNNNSALGHWALNNNVSGSVNTALGWFALSSSTNTSANTAIGSTALKNITGGQMNIAIGSGAIEDATGGDYNVAIGGDALHQNSVGSYNVAIGSNALFSNTGSGTYNAGNGITWTNANSNVAVGSNALYANTTGSYNTAVGNSALQNAVGTINNVAIGVDALNANTSGWDNTALGAYTLMNNTTSQGVAVGSHALQANTTGFGNTALGSYVLYQNTTGNHNTALGYQSGYNTNNNSNLNTLVGYKSDTVSGTLVTNATALGANAVVTTSNTIQLGDPNVTLVQTSGTVSATGFVLNGSSLDSRIQLIENSVASDLATVEEVTVTMTYIFAVSDELASAQNDIDNLLGTIPNINGIYSNTSVGSNTYFNYDNSNSVDNTAIGQDALKNNSASENTAIGSLALRANTSGDSNTGLGAGALYNNTTGFNNVALGVAALFENVSGRSNNAIGYDALRDNTGSYNVAIGEVAGYSNTTGNNNTLIGFDADVASGALTNATALGAKAVVANSNSFAFGDKDVTKWAFGLSTTDSGNAIQVGEDTTNGNGASLTSAGVWTNASSILFKTNFIELDNEWILKKINSISVKKWKYKNTNETHIGPTSEEFIETFDVGNGLDKSHLGTIDVSGVALRGVQALIDKIETQKEEINTLKSELDILKNLVQTLIENQ